MDKATIEGWLRDHPDAPQEVLQSLINRLKLIKKENNESEKTKIKQQELDG